MTEYFILREDKETEFWQEMAKQEANSPSHALRLFDPGEGNYVAIPVRSWKPLAVSVKQVTKVTIG